MFFSAVIFFQFLDFGIPWTWLRIEMWIRIRIDQKCWIRIRILVKTNADPKLCCLDS